jgi:hypothetical protein
VVGSGDANVGDNCARNVELRFGEAGTESLHDLADTWTSHPQLQLMPLTGERQGPPVRRPYVD